MSEHISHACLEIAWLVLRTGRLESKSPEEKVIPEGLWFISQASVVSAGAHRPRASHLGSRSRSYPGETSAMSHHSDWEVAGAQGWATAWLCV